jgi:hypothetical protein
MKLQRNLSTPESRKLWEFIDETRRTVEQWPDWMKGTGSYAASSPRKRQATAQRSQAKKKG